MRQSGLALAYHGLGRTAESLDILRELGEEHPDWALNIADAHTYRGDVDAAFAALERGLRERDPGMKLLRVESLLKPLHSDPRWGALLETVGLSDEQVAELSLEVKLPR